MVGGVLLALAAPSVWAAEPGSFTREDWDSIMRYVNFAILAALVIKFARRPIANFLKDKKEEVGREILRLEQSKRQVESETREIQIQLDAGQQRLALIKEKIIAEGQNRREQLIAEAQEDARMLLERTRGKIESRIRDAHELLRGELVDMAADLAAVKLPAAVTPADHERQLRHWFDFTEQASG
jgi:F-type H+-transporting ATPase subunit b